MGYGAAGDMAIKQETLPGISSLHRPCASNASHHCIPTRPSSDGANGESWHQFSHSGVNAPLRGVVLRGPSLLPASFGTVTVVHTGFGETDNVKLELRNTFLLLKSTHN